MAELVARARGGEVFRIVGGKEQPWKKIRERKDDLNHYNEDPFTHAQNEKYHLALKTPRGQEILNKLKNDVMSIKMHSFLYLKFKSPHVRQFKNTNFKDKTLHSRCFNRLSLKDLGISKELVYATLVEGKILTY